MADGTKKPKGLLWTGIILIILGIAGCGGGCGALLSGVGSAVNEASKAIRNGQSTPYGETVEFARGRDGIVFLLASSPGANCTARDNRGARVSVELPSGVSGSTDANGEKYHLVGIFPTDDDHSYQVTCQSGAEGGFVAVRITGALANSSLLGASVVGIFAGAGLIILGLILLIAGIVARSRWKKRNSAPPAPPGYPMPGSPPPPPGYGQAPYGQPGHGQPGAPPPPPGYGQPAPPYTPPPAPGYDQQQYAPPPAPGYDQPPAWAPPAAPGYEPTPTPAAGQPAYPPPPPYEQPVAPAYEAPSQPPYEPPPAPAPAPAAPVYDTPTPAYEAPPPPAPPAPAYEPPPAAGAESATPEAPDQTPPPPPPPPPDQPA